MATSANEFALILRDFKKAYAKHGSSGFFLCGQTPEEYETDHVAFQRVSKLMGFIPLSEWTEGIVAKGYWVVSPKWERRQTDKRTWSVSLREHYDSFKKLASRAGAALPLSFRKQIEHEPSGPVSWWLCFLWHKFRPSPDDLLSPNGTDRKIRLLWADPFFTSIEAIEEAGLAGLDAVNGETVGKIDSLCHGVNELRSQMDLYRPTGRAVLEREELELLAEAAASIAVERVTQIAIVTPKPKRGGKLTSDPNEDRRVAEAWGTGLYPGYKDLARGLGNGWNYKRVKAAIDRDRKR